MKDTAVIKERLEALVRHAGSQRAAAAALGVREETFSRWMKGHRHPQGRIVMRLLAREPICRKGRRTNK